MVTREIPDDDNYQKPRACSTTPATSVLVILAIVQFGLLVYRVVSFGDTAWWISLLLGLASTS